MQKTMQVEPISTMQQRPQNVLRMLDAGPVVLSVRGKGAAVITSMETWDAMADRMAQLERAALAAVRSAEVDAGHFVTGEELERQLAEIV